MTHSLALAAATLVAIVHAQPASADVLTAGQTLRVSFTVDNNFSAPPDTLWFNLGDTNVLAPTGARTAELFDWHSSLGVHTDPTQGNVTGLLPLSPSNLFRSATSLFTFNNPAVIDFVPILDGTIVGQLDYTFQTGAQEVDLAQVELELYQSTGASTGILVSPAPTIVSIQIVDPANFTSFCSGDGSGAPCPCGNTGAAGEGCANSSGAGAVLSATGSINIGADDLAFEAMNLSPGQPALLFAGEAEVNGGAGVLFGDGLRCAGTNVKRLGVRVPDAAGTANWGPGLGALGGWSVGDTRRFQGWYRDPIGSACGADFNLTQGIRATFQM